VRLQLIFSQYGIHSERVWFFHLILICCLYPSCLVVLCFAVRCCALRLMSVLFVLLRSASLCFACLLKEHSLCFAVRCGIMFGFACIALLSARLCSALHSLGLRSISFHCSVSPLLGMVVFFCFAFPYCPLCGQVISVWGHAVVLYKIVRRCCRNSQSINRVFCHLPGVT
jgi:hypothetical protein